MDNKTIQELISNNKQLEGIFSILNGDTPERTGITTILSTLYLPEKEFTLVSERILNECEKSINNINDKLILVQAINSAGMKLEDFTNVFEKITKEIEKTFKDKISEQKINFLKRFLSLIVNAISNTEGIAKRIISVPIELCHENAKIPTYAKLGDAGLDVYAIEDIVINPGETKKIPIGIKCALPLGYEFEVRPRSSLSLNTPLRISNTPGTIDSGYRDEIAIIVTNTDPKIKDVIFEKDVYKSILYGQSYTITTGMRFAQLILKEVPTCSFYQVDKINSIDFDRGGGFGSTGT